MFDLIGDLRQAVRALGKAPGQTALLVSTLALAIGTTTIGFSFADTIVLRGLPIAEPADTIIMYAVDARQADRRVGVFFDDYLDFRERVRGVERLSAWSRERATLVRGDGAYAAEVSWVAGDLFGAWGIRALLGRLPRPGDDEPGAPRVAVLAHHYWQRMFGGSSSVIGETIRLNGVPHQIVGVVEPAIEFGNFSAVSVWAPLTLERSKARDARSVVVTGRLAEGATVEGAAAELAGIARALEQQHPATNRGRGVLVRESSRAIGGPNFWTVMALLVTAVTLIMVIASANVAGILLARAAVRQREFGLRIALGAGRSRVFRQVLVEGLVLAVFGAASGLLTAETGLRLIRSVEAEAIFRQIVLDWHEVAFVALLAIATPLLFSLAPARAAMRTSLPALLNAGGPRVAASAGRGRGLLVIAQLALAVTLVTVGGLVLRTAAALSAAPDGFDASRLLVFHLTFDEAEYPDRASRLRLVRAVEARLAGAGGVAAVGALDALPRVSIEAAAPIEIDGRAFPEGEPAPWVNLVGVDEGTLETLQVPLLAGRMLERGEIETDADVALVSALTATRHFGGIGQALGRRVHVGSPGRLRSRRIVGITGDVRNADPERGMPPRVWVPLSEPRTVALAARAVADPRGLASAARQAVHAADPNLPVEGLETYEQAIARRTGSDRVVYGMLLSFAGVALLFAATGLYGLVAFNAGQRRAEFGTRLALGAQVRDVARLVLGEAFGLLTAGLALGLAGGLAAATALRSIFYGVTPLDPLNILGVVVLLAMVTLAASVMPAWKAARLDLVQSLRSE